MRDQMISPATARHPADFDAVRLPQSLRDWLDSPTVSIGGGGVRARAEHDPCLTGKPVWNFDDKGQRR
jgi:hypothetical protein